MLDARHLTGVFLNYEASEIVRNILKLNPLLHNDIIAKLMSLLEMDLISCALELRSILAERDLKLGLFQSCLRQSLFFFSFSEILFLKDIFDNKSSTALWTYSFVTVRSKIEESTKEAGLV